MDEGEGEVRQGKLQSNEMQCHLQCPNEPGKDRQLSQQAGLGGMRGSSARKGHTRVLLSADRGSYSWEM